MDKKVFFYTKTNKQKMGKFNQSDPDTVALKKMKKLFNESREKLNLESVK